jgi:hypothetical protein
MTLQVVGLFCEDIREKKSGQITIVGIFPDNVNIPPPPPSISNPEVPQTTIIPKLGLYIRAHLGLEDDPGPMTVKLIMADGEQLVLGTFDAEIIAQSKNRHQKMDCPWLVFCIIR